MGVTGACTARPVLGTTRGVFFGGMVKRDAEVTSPFVFFATLSQRSQVCHLTVMPAAPRDCPAYRRLTYKKIQAQGILHQSYTLGDTIGNDTFTLYSCKRQGLLPDEICAAEDTERITISGAYRSGVRLITTQIHACIGMVQMLSSGGHADSSAAGDFSSRLGFLSALFSRFLEEVRKSTDDEFQSATFDWYLHLSYEHSEDVHSRKCKCKDFVQVQGGCPHLDEVVWRIMTWFLQNASMARRQSVANGAQCEISVGFCAFGIYNASDISYINQRLGPLFLRPGEDYVVANVGGGQQLCPVGGSSVPAKRVRLSCKFTRILVLINVREKYQ